MDAVIGLGSNLGDRLRSLRHATAELMKFGRVQARSAVYETDPVGGPPQPKFLNAALWLVTELVPEALLEGLHRIEALAGRTRTGERCSPRTLDLDLLLLGRTGETVLVTQKLVIPHPRLHERAFALRPVLDLAPSLIHPALGVPLSDLLVSLPRASSKTQPVGWL
ncbi:MAG TPA: 2-amino-4-hydroxy-6-hydroxymethyldihydropteridine diphosphokinase [Pseudomonadota bacterium]|nr:2-amino-4-hydroxy-6-hydroxymethyldihydropteridine diphosphokinase [Pseudomonadota bacterium]